MGEDATLPGGGSGGVVGRAGGAVAEPQARAPSAGAAALARARERFGEDRYYDRLMKLYGGVSA